VSLFEDVVFYLGRRRAVARLRVETDGEDDEAVRVGVVLSLPVAIANIRRWVEQEDHAEWLSAGIARIPQTLAADLDALLASTPATDLGNDVLDLALGEDAPRIVGRLASRAQVDERAGARLLAITASALLAHLADRYRGEPNPEILRSDLHDEERELDETGWGPWIDEMIASGSLLVDLDRWQRERQADSTSSSASVAPPPDIDQAWAGRDLTGPITGAIDSRALRTGRNRDDGFIGSPATSDAYTNGGGDRAGARGEARPLEYAPAGEPPPLPTGRSSRSATGEVRMGGARWETDQRFDRLADSPGAPAKRPSSPTRAAQAPVDWDGGGSWFSERRGLVVLLGLAAVVGLLAFVLLRNGAEPDDEVVADEAASPTTAATEEGSATTTSGGGAAGSDTATAAPVGPQRIVVPLLDPLGVTDGTGTANLDLDPNTGEICYEFTVEGVDSPYDGHIHVGPLGVKGGIVVDFGLLNGATNGCIANSPAGTAAILADLGGHYAEFHDADGVATVRAQLGDPTAGGPIADTSGQDAEGAFARIEPGRLVLTGEVPDQVTIDKYLETFADLDPTSIEIVNELVIVPGAPRPSGRILVDDTVFFEFDSADLVDPETTVLRDLATIFKARPAWRMTVVGHTDSVGTDVYNLELSLRRATAVRDALIAAGVSADALTVEGAGSTAPIASNDTEQGQSLNRRIEVEVIPG
jgi:outer membrane protein OmpA-like peptidoglycan-associated protein